MPLSLRCLSAIAFGLMSATICHAQATTPACVVPTASTAGVSTALIVDALTGRFHLAGAGATNAPTKLPQGAVAVSVINQNPFLFTYSLSVGVEPITAAPLVAVMSAVAQAVGLPAGIVPTGGGGAAPAAMLGLVTAPGLWPVPASCPAPQRDQAQVYLAYLRELASRHSNARNDVREDDERFNVAILAPLTAAEALRSSMTMPAAACTAVVESATQLVGKRPAFRAVELRLDEGREHLSELSRTVVAIKNTIDFYRKAFDSTCMVPEIESLLAAVDYDVDAAATRHGDAADALEKLSAAAAAAEATLKGGAFTQTRVAHADDPARLTVSVRRLPKGDTEGEGTVIADRRFEMGDTRRMATSVGLLGGRWREADKGDLFRYQPVLAPNPQAAEPVEEGEEPPSPTITVVGLERRGRGITLPSGLVHFRTWPGPYLTVGAGPTGEGGIYSLSYILGGSYLVGKRLMLTAGAVWGFGQKLPDSLALSPPTRLPDATESISTEKELRHGFLAGISFAVF